jgi:hypothetical protein
MKAPNLDAILRKGGPYNPEAMSYGDARRIAHAFYVKTAGYASVPAMLTAPESQHKLGMSDRPAYGLSLAAAASSGYNVCQWSTANCRAVCVLRTAGKGTLRSVRAARELKTQFLAVEPQAFVTLVWHELRKAARKHGGIDFRPNVASDLRWEHIAPAWLEVEGVRVYDYTKAPATKRTPTENYRLVFSVSELQRSETRAVEYLRDGQNAAVVFDTKKGHALPATWKGYPVLDADTSDSRIDDPAGHVVGLRAKGSARGTTAGGFVKRGEAS